MTDRPIARVTNLSKKHQALSLVLQGFSREYICEQVGVTSENLDQILGNISREMESDLEPLRETLLAVSIFRLEDLLNRNYAILNKMEEEAKKPLTDEKGKPILGHDGKPIKSMFSVRDYNATSKLIKEIILAQIDLLNPRAEGRPAKNVIPGTAQAMPEAPTTLKATDDRYMALLQELAEEAGVEVVE